MNFTGKIVEDYLLRLPHVMSGHVMPVVFAPLLVSCPCHLSWCHVLARHAKPSHVISSRVMSCRAMSCHVMPCFVISSRVSFFRVRSCHVMSCHGRRVMSRDRSPYVVSLVSYFMYHVLSLLIVFCHVCHLRRLFIPVMLCYVLQSLLVSCHFVSCNDLPR